MATATESTIHEMSRVLLIDDDPVVARALRRVLARDGHDCDHYTNPIAAIARVKTRPYDLVITDFRMPELDGLRVASQIAAEAPDLPIILLTGSFDVDLERVRAAGVVAVLSKPIDGQLLLAAVRKHARVPTGPDQPQS
jgi:CheY-like chemotaxis protein